ncbi:MAG: hypothetical protein ACK4VY_03925, partial [Brevundimonas sp.]
MRRAPRVTTALFAAAGLALCAGAASAQAPAGATGEARSLRYLNWAGRGETVRPAPVAVAPEQPVDRDQPRLRRPNTVIPHGGFATAVPAPSRPGLTPAPGARRSLTPANAWMQPAPPAPAPVPAAPVPRSAAPPPAARTVP